MHHIQALPLRPGARAGHSNLGRVLGLLVTLGLALIFSVGVAMGAAVGLGFAPEFDRSIVLSDRYHLVIHNGPLPTCASIPNPPQHDCLGVGSQPRVFSVDQLTSEGARSLVWFRLPAR
jgi:hypothetical protein